MPTYYLDMPREMYNVMRLLRLDVKKGFRSYDITGIKTLRSVQSNHDNKRTLNRFSFKIKICNFDFSGDAIPSFLTSFSSTTDLPNYSYEKYLLCFSHCHVILSLDFLTRSMHSYFFNLFLYFLHFLFLTFFYEFARIFKA